MFTQFKRLTWKASLLATLINLLAFTIALAAAGDLDATFNGSGVALTDFGVRADVTYDIAIQSNNGKIVSVGYSGGAGGNDFFVTRHKPDGSLDTTFSGDGGVITNFGGNDIAWSVEVQSDGKITAAGTTCNTSAVCNVALVRYNANGTLDTTFSGDGKVVTDFSGSDNGAGGGLAIQSDGKIIVGGYMFNGTDYDFAVYRYNVNGSLDTTFSGDGRVRFGFGSGRNDSATALDIQDTDQKIIVVGHSRGSANGDDFAIARLNPGGSFDTTFSGDGRQVTSFGADESAFGFAGQQDGKMVVVGQKTNLAGTMSTVVIARYMPNGSLDDTFGQQLPNGKRSGKQVFSIIPGLWSYASDAIVQPQGGKIVVLGSTDVGGGVFDFAIVRLNPGGGFDTTFGGTGKVTIDFGGNDEAYALARQSSDNKYVLGGYSSVGAGGSDFALARVLP